MASACELACGEMAGALSCHGAAAAGVSDGGAMPGMRHCAMCVKAPSVGVVRTAMLCSSDVCGVEPVVVRDSAFDGGQVFLNVPAGVLEGVAPAHVRFARAETPPLCGSSSVSLHTILRV
jgi:hypothetical protein